MRWRVIPGNAMCSGESPRGASEFGAKHVERLLANGKADSAGQICETVLQQGYAFGHRRWARFYDLLHYKKHLGKRRPDRCRAGARLEFDPREQNMHPAWYV